MMTRSLTAVRRRYRADFILLVGVLIFWAAPFVLHAQRNSWRPDDIRPLTKLPWPGADAKPLDTVLDQIFREPNEEIRYAVLDRYLSVIPVEQFSEAYEKCIVLEGSQTPDQLVELLLRIWARRDPRACWTKTKTLFDLVGIEHGFLGYDSYVDCPKITVQNRDAIRASCYWIEERAALLGFITGLQQSSLSKDEQVRLMKECADIWFARFKTWPGEQMHWYYSHRQLHSGGDPSGILHAFDFTLDELKRYGLAVRDDEGAAMAEIVLRRWLEKEPHAAVEILHKIAKENVELKAAAADEVKQGNVPDSQWSIPFPSREWLYLWHALDSEGMLKWASVTGSSSDRTVLAVRGLLLSRVDAATRDQWFKAAKAADEHHQVFVDLLGEWSIWDFKAAMDAALEEDTEDAGYASQIQYRATHGFAPTNLRHANLGLLREFDVETLRKKFADDYLYDWATESMECWGRIDVGEAARYGLEGLMKLHYFPQSDLIKYIKGENNEFSDTGDMIDRTFCCLRVWAVVRPDEMKAWIATIRDAAMRDALTWMLENPWGTGENVEE